MIKKYEAIRAYDPGITYAVDGGSESFVLRHTLPKYGERGVVRVIHANRGYYYISYQERLGDSGGQKLAGWTQFIIKLPNQALEPTPTSGTSAAEQPLVPAAVVAHL